MLAQEMKTTAHGVGVHLTTKHSFYIKLAFLSALLITFIPHDMVAQCATCPAEQSCTVPGAIELFEGAIVSAGSTYVVNGNSTLSSIIMDGGDLIICGSLDLTTITFNSGQIFINTFASMSTSNSGTALVFGNGCSIYNYGQLSFASSVVTGPNNLISNCNLNSVLTIPFNQLVVQGPNSQIINNGFMQTSYIITSSNNTGQPFCLGQASATVTGIMINEYTNAFSSPVFNSCLSVTNLFINSAPMTNTPNTTLCYDSTTVNFIGAPNFGAATVQNNCFSCGILLADNPLNFSVSDFFGTAQLSWQIQDYKNIEFFELQKLNRFSKFEHLAFIGVNEFTNSHSFNFFDNSVRPGGIYYYRIRILYKDKRAEHTISRSVKISESTEQFLYPNPTESGEFYVKHGVDVLEIANALGERIPFLQHDNKINFVTAVTSGFYVVKYANREKIIVEKLVVR